VSAQFVPWTVCIISAPFTSGYHLCHGLFISFLCCVFLCCVPLGSWTRVHHIDEYENCPKTFPWTRDLVSTSRELGKN